MTDTALDTKRSPAPSIHAYRSDEEDKKLYVPLYNEHVDISGVDERKLVRKLDFRLISWLSLLYLLSFLDRTSIGNAKVRHASIGVCRPIGLDV